MQIKYDRVLGGYAYPVKKKEIRRLREVVAEDLLDMIASIRFLCVFNTTWDGRVRRYGEKYYIKINFCLKGDNPTYFASEKSKFVDVVHGRGGRRGRRREFYRWKQWQAREYAMFVILHEIGHIILREGLNDEYEFIEHTMDKEQWCDNYSEYMTGKLYGRQYRY